MTDIVTVPAGDFTPGALATLQFPAALINAAWSQANDKFASFESKMSLVTNLGGTGWLDDAAAPTISAGTASVTAPALTSASVTAPAMTESSLTTPALTSASVTAPALTSASTTTPADPGVTIPTTLDASTIFSSFDTKQLEQWNQMVQGFVNFRSTYFPDESAAYTAAEDWLQAAISSPSGLPAATAAQMLTDDKDRILAEATRASDAVVARFAGARFPMPPDAESAAVLAIQQTAQGEIASSARKITIAGIEHLKFAIEKILSLRQIAMSAALDYVKTLAGASPVATQLVGAGYEAQSRLIGAAAGYYNARTSAAEALMKNSQFNVGAALQYAAEGTKNSQFNVGSAIQIADIANKNAQFNVGASLQYAAEGSKTSQFNVGAALQYAAEGTKNSQFNVGSAIQIADIANKNAQFNVGASLQYAAEGSKTSQFNVGAALQYAETATKNAQFNVANALTAAEKNQMAALTVLEDKLKALMSELAALAQMATSLYNNLHASAGTSYAVNGSDGSG